MQMKVARLLVDCLREEGVTRIYGIPGEENLDIMDEIDSAGIEFVLTRHEQAAAFMAATEGRLTGRPGICLSTLGPGATNLVTGVADAYLSNVPMIALVGQAGAERRDPPQKQVLDLLAMFGPLTKKTIDVSEPGLVRKAMKDAFLVAMEERSGPVMVQLPEDIMKMRPDVQVQSDERTCEPNAINDTTIDALRCMIIASDRPLAIIGHGVLRGKAVDEARSFCRAWNIPTGCTWMAAGAMPFDDALSLGTIGMRNSDLVKSAYEEADMVVLIGYDVSEFQPKFWNKGRVKKVMFLGKCPLGTAKELVVDAAAIGPLATILRPLSANAIPKKEWAVNHRSSLINELARPASGPRGVVQALRRQMQHDDILISDVGAHLIWLAKYYPSYKENTLLLQNGLISMGVAVPSALAARKVHPEKKVVAVVGDGGFLMSSSELETAKRSGVNFITVIFNDGGLGLIREKMRRGYGRASNVDLTSPDIPGYARSFGAEGYAVDENDFERVLHDCLARDVLAVIDVRADYSEIDHLF